MRSNLLGAKQQTNPQDSCKAEDESMMIWVFCICVCLLYALIPFYNLLKNL